MPLDSPMTDVTNGTYSALLNILDDASEEKAGAERAKRAVVNILDDIWIERGHSDHSRRAVTNILEDAETEKRNLANAQTALVNILEDFDDEKSKVQAVNAALNSEISQRRVIENSLVSANASAAVANKELESFSYSVAHDLRAPLRSIDGFTHALVEDYADKLDEQGLSFLNQIRSSAQKMAMLIDDLLSLSRVARHELRRDRTDLGSIAQSCVEALRRAQPERVVDVAIASDLSVDADRQLLSIVLENLIGNAWKFTAQVNQPKIEIGEVDEGEKRIFFVRDNGAGFDMKYADKLFQPFQRLHTRDQFEGSGIGLATVQRIIHRHNGQLWASGAPGQGATFYFTVGDRA